MMWAARKRTFAEVRVCGRRRKVVRWPQYADMMDSAMKSRVIGATGFKARCLSLLNEVELRASDITITKRGIPVAVLSPEVIRKNTTRLTLPDGRCSVTPKTSALFLNRDRNGAL